MIKFIVPKAFVVIYLAMTSIAETREIADISMPISEDSQSRATIDIPNISGSRQAMQEINVLDFGASTSGSAATNSISFQAATRRACTTRGGARIIIPAGTYMVDIEKGIPFDLSGCLGVSIEGAGVQSTLILPKGTGDLIYISGPADQDFGGYGTISGIRIYRQDSPESGAAIHLKQASEEFITNVEAAGFFNDFWVESSTNVYFSNVTPGGRDGTTGSSLWRFSRHTGNGNNSGIFISNSASSPTPRDGYEYGMTISNVDGIQVSNMHIGMTSKAALLVSPLNEDDPIDNLFFTNVNFDSAGYGVLCIEPSGYLAHMGEWTFISAISELNTGAGFSSDCKNLSDVRAPGMIFLRNGTNGLSLSAGNAFNFEGSLFSDNNTENHDASHVLVAGSATNVSLDGVQYLPSLHRVPYNLVVAGSADGVSALSSSFSGAKSADVDLQTTGVHVSITTSNTDKKSPIIRIPGFIDTSPDGNGYSLKIGNLIEEDVASLHYSLEGPTPRLTSCGKHPDIDASASDSSGTVSVGYGATRCVITFAHAYRRSNHCQVVAQNAPSRLAFSYSLLAITLWATPLAGKFDYRCDGY